MLRQTAGYEGIPVPARPETLLAALEEESIHAALVVLEDGGRTLSLLAEIQNRRPCLPLVVVQVERSADVVLEGLRRGVRAFLDIASSPAEVAAALAAIQAGGFYLTQQTLDLLRHASASPAETPGACPLSPRQRQVLTLVADGMSTAEIAATLGVSPRTVDSHRLAISKRLGVRSVADLIRYAIRQGLVHDD